MHITFAALVALAAVAVMPPDASAQATCRQKCIDQEQACLKRTGNKSQCGRTAQACLAKCR